MESIFGLGSCFGFFGLKALVSPSFVAGCDFESIN